MPTTNPRINVTLSVSLDALVGRMAAHTRVSKSQVLRELLEAAEPGLQRAVTLMDLAQDASASVRQQIGGEMAHGLSQAEDVLKGILARMDTATVDLVSQAEAVQGKRPARVAARRSGGSQGGTSRSAPGGASGVENPTASNRGVKSPNRSGNVGGKK